ncbi:hypothetical protein BV25DRAFT_946750 [Artomyces pyxidatus]|uniref:Uncharacterized protein n=1 Tax=Artomyces pyxidatus TaxID=48021 RepID=A0ACB8SWL2_9AGAM|nr:hypothetical protein BV25DRAFT_946750 [Artomyces pyxidatus]
MRSSTPSSVADYDFISPSSSPELVPLQDMSSLHLPAVGELDISSKLSAMGHSDGDVKTIKHPRFYFEDGNTTFEVEHVLYHVHRYFFRDSNILAGATIASASPIELQGVKTREFDAFLSIIYPDGRNYKTCELTTVDEWTSVLRLATEWGFVSIRGLAVERLGVIASAVDKIVLAHAHALRAWLAPAYAELCVRAAPLSAAEGRRLGVEEVLLVCAMRESTRDAVPLFSEEEIVLRVAEHLCPPPQGAAEGWAAEESAEPGVLFSQEEVDRKRDERIAAASGKSKSGKSASRLMFG